jgi:hypothetical protein
VIETIVSQYCGHWSSAGLTRCTHFPEPKALEAWACPQARLHGNVALGRQTTQAAIGATVLHSVFLSGNMDNESNCEAGIIHFPYGKTMGG